ncbi:MAG TPA: hypothetical protein VEW46_03805 [Pyrinomonadaceae bacterium]|jgi:predicted DNA-binding protein|nr:hypothetical protein [Pyrinomonadaceae bacterium]
MKKFYHNPSITMDTKTFNQLRLMVEKTGMTQSAIVRHLIADGAERLEQSPVRNPLLKT